MTRHVLWRPISELYRAWFNPVAQIEFRLFASLIEYLPENASKHSIFLDVPDGTTIYNVIDRFNIPRDKAHLVILNGVYVHIKDRDTYKLREGDALALWPPVAGG